MSTLLLRDAEVEGDRVSVRVQGSLVTHVGPSRLGDGADVVIDCGGGALLPGLHDHHVHLLSMAAAARSVDVSRDFDTAVRAAHGRAVPGGALRAINYDEQDAGPLDRWRLDALAPGRAVRVQHRSGALWVLSTAALRELGEVGEDVTGVERDQAGQPTGRLFRRDGWLHRRLPFDVPPDLSDVGRRLASFGVTGVTDCTPAAALDYFDSIAAAVRSGALPVTVVATGGPELADASFPEPLERGPVKVLISDHALPSLDELGQWFARAHRAGRPVAVHCVTRASLLLAVAAWHEVGVAPGDRIEHASVVPSEVMTTLADLALSVVTQPAFVAARGDAYLRDVERSEQPDLYRCASLIDAGVAVGGSTDAPFGPDDPWTAVWAAIERRSPSGVPVGSDRGLPPLAALSLFLGSSQRPGGPIRRVRPGGAADLCLLDVPLQQALDDPSQRHVAVTISGGRRTFEA